MSHIQVIIQLPLEYNLLPRQTKREKVEEIKFLETYNELFDMAGGVSTSTLPITGAWKNPRTGNKIDDQCVVYNIVIECLDKDDITKNKKIQELIEYKKKLIKRFQQDQIYMLAIPCYWL